MATQTYYGGENSFNRSAAMVLALVSSVVLSPLYVKRKTDTTPRFETKWSSGYVLPMVLAGLIVAIKTVSSSSSTSSMQRGVRATVFPSLDSSSVLRIGSTSYGLFGILVLLFLVLSWQGSVQEFLWR